MLEAPMNKMQGKETTKANGSNTPAVEHSPVFTFYFPAEGVTIEAKSLNEAQAKLAELIKKNK